MSGVSMNRALFRPTRSVCAIGSVDKYSGKTTISVPTMLRSTYANRSCFAAGKSLRNTRSTDYVRRVMKSGTFAVSATSESSGSSSSGLKALPRMVENVADDPKLGNPLQRYQRLSTGWMGVILELEGILVGSTWSSHRHAWLSVAEEEGKPPPLQWALKRAEGMKAEQVISEVFHWTRNPAEIRRIAIRKEEIYREAVGDVDFTLLPGVNKLLETLRKNDVPMALASSDPEERVLATLEAAGITDYFEAVVTAGDCQYSRPDPEPYLLAAQMIGRPPVRCVVIGGSNASIEAAHEAGMQCVAVANCAPMYELVSGDLVVKELGEISFVNLKQLFQLEKLTSWDNEEEPEVEPEEDSSGGPPSLGTLTWDL